MRGPTSSRIRTVHVAAVLAAMLAVGMAGPVAARKPPAPSPSPGASVSIAATGTVAPDGESVVVDVTVNCPLGWSFSSGYLYVLQGSTGGSGTFDATCTGTPQVAHAKAINGNRFTLGSWTATAYLNIERNGQRAQVSASRTVELQPGVRARVADEGQLTGTSGGGARLAVSVACTRGATGAASSLTLSQGSAQGSASFTPTCDGQTRTVVLSIGASGGTFHTGGAMGAASVSATWNGGSFSGVDSRAVTILDSSSGDTTPPTTPANLSANVFGDGETWLSWSASTDNATPSALLTYEVFLNGQLDQTIGGGFTQAILYAELGRLNTIDVVAVDGAGNRSAPATTTVDLR
jgi:hypothetical protein